jgi:hypothetical protein
MTTLGLIGSGNIGAAVAALGPNATAGTARQAAEQGDIVVVTIPLRAYQSVLAAPLAGKIVIDTNNYYWQRDGRFAELDDGSSTSSELLAAHLPGGTVGEGLQPHSVHRACRRPTGSEHGPRGDRPHRGGYREKHVRHRHHHTGT